MDRNSNLSLNTKDFSHLLRRAHEGSEEAIIAICQRYLVEGELGLDCTEIAQWMHRAANIGHRDAQYELGYFYEYVEGVEQNYHLAAEWYGKAAEQGHAEAQYNLGYFYESGKGVEQNYQTAVEWYQKAAEQDFAEAQNNLGVLYSRGKGVEQNERMALEWYRKADARASLAPPWEGWVGPSVRDKLTARTENQ